MQAIVDFLANNYLWFIVISLILIFALIGYLVDTSERNSKSNDLEEQMLDGNSLDSTSSEKVELGSNIAFNMSMNSKKLTKDAAVENIDNGVKPEDHDIIETEILDI